MLDLDMSPYGVFVWSSWAISAAALAAISIRALIAARRARHRVQLEHQEYPQGGQGGDGDQGEPAVHLRASSRRASSRFQRRAAIRARIEMAARAAALIAQDDQTKTP